MAIGYVLLEVEAGKEREVYRALQAIDGLAEVFPLFGQFDFIAKVEARDFDDLGKIIVTNVRTIPGVRSTQTLTVTKM